MSVSTEDFGAFLFAHRANYQCPFCDNPMLRFNVSSLDVVADLAIPVHPAPTQPANQSHNFYSISCERCGHTDFFHKAAVHSWLDERAAPKAGLAS